MVSGRVATRSWLPYVVAVVAGLGVITATYLVVRPDPTGCVPLVVSSSSEKSSLISDIAEDYNSKDRRFGGHCAAVTVHGLNSGEAMEALAVGWKKDGTEMDGRPQVWLPTSTLWTEQLTLRNPDALPLGSYPSIANSPLVIAIPKEQGAALQKHSGGFGWGDVLGVSNQDGWATFGHPEWGKFAFSKDNPALSTSGLAATIATYYAATKKTRDLTVNDLNRPEVTQFVRGIEANVSHYTDDVVDLLRRRAEADLSRGDDSTRADISAMVMQESLVYLYNKGKLSPEGVPPRMPLAVLHPREGTYQLNHPYVVLPGLNEEQRLAADDFRKFLQEEQQQKVVRDSGLRDRNGNASADAIKSMEAYGAPARAYFAEPDPAVVNAILENWKKLSKKANILFAIDTSGSMKDPNNPYRLQKATEAAGKGLALLGAEDRVALWSFSSKQHPKAPYSERIPLSKFDHGVFAGKLAELRAEGDTALYATVRAAHQHLLKKYDPNRINAVVVLTDGENTDPVDNDLAALLRDIRLDPERPVKVFCIAFDKDSDLAALDKIAKASGGKAFNAQNPEKIDEVFELVVRSFGAG
ncbi:substrate-binding and VWA domain-containing protein [Micromonospora polyrhachis]|uniref:Ca-activated chloride channel family protein n=1 Tax=Micromonospora polyrhachis TaxID=1282883 RepID=A0A7W7SRH7_9ACTN|nr:extracellular solute-binding protein [Micromonospora polyrhachis]MBB4959623.1 Ca-activated chloride channel family protein [Micromonospora polyrhachis]